MWEVRRGSSRQPLGVLFGWDEHARAKYVLEARSAVIAVACQLRELGRPVEIWTREAHALAGR